MTIIRILGFIFTVGLLTASSPLAADSAEPFARRLNYSIILPASPSAVETFAASELRDFLPRAYTKALVFNNKNESLCFYVGIGVKSMLAGFDDLPEFGENFGVSVRGRNILLYGFDDAVKPLDSIGRTGTLLAVYYFLTRYAGIEFFFPGENGTAIIPNTPITLTRKDDIPIPSFYLRAFYQKTSDFTKIERQLFAKRMLSSKPLWLRSRSYYFETWGKKYFKSHPKYFAEVNGKRVFHHYHNCNPCFSNPEVIRRFAGEIIEIFRSHPEIQSVRMFSDNKYGPCQCAKCSSSAVRKISLREGNYSEEYFAFVARVANVVFRVFPNRRIICNTKRNHYDHPPRSIKLDKRVTIDFLTSRSDPRAYPGILRDQIRKIDAWVADGHTVFIKSYNRYPHFKNYPLMTQQHIAQAARMLKGHILGIQRSDSGKDTPFAFSALNNYIQGRILFCCSEDVDDLVAKFVAHAFPDAEPEMIAFYREMERLWAGKESFSMDPLFDIYTPANLARPLALLKSAKQKMKRESWLFARLEPAFVSLYRKSMAIDRTAIEEQQRKNRVPVLIRRINAAITIDGNIGKDEWAGSLAIPLQPALTVRPDTGDAFQTSSARLLHDGSKLYIALAANEQRINNLTVTHCRRNGEGSPWSDDSFEIMLAPEGKRPYYQIVINAVGFFRVLTVGNQSGRKPDMLDMVDRVAVTKSNNGFRIELSVFLAKIPGASLAKDWKFNIFRNRIVDHDAGAHNSPRQASGLSLFGRSFHDLSTYRILHWE